ncbi:coiled-coil domain-containing protein 97 [Tribolium madens]|uniref:coiled-coil domain-containing protein 97 n=1 Tax=Tribolium madens TaxID=41895 RepID=UPI001CF71D5E|nr:coiled-coil domain-containing protein 97 [Tribolium madens]XP_044256065.1 coiled-coil domain-containing protein 97 [Tribolium madens]XP_044256066.1 coiled-coil domain-containing protein 97 [Tribolium madens]
MTMEVEVEEVETVEVDAIKIIDFLTSKESICFKSQQRGEDDLTKQQKSDIALELYYKSKLNFLVRFGKHLEKNHLDFFQKFTKNCAESAEISIVLKEFLSSVTKSQQTNVKNRRYEALKELIREDSYFSEIEMMKRNPLLYEQLVGQYLTEDEKAERDKINIDEEATLVKVLIEGIERDDAQVKRKKQEEFEDGMKEEEEGSSDSGDSSGTSKQTYSQWGEFSDEPIVRSIKRVKKKHITPQEQLLLKEEFISTMYLDFLNGKDEDFDYSAVDNNDKYDSTETKENDEEDKYFDSEEPENVNEAGQEESEDELDIFMSALNQNPAVSQLSKDIQKL